MAAPLAEIGVLWAICAVRNNAALSGDGDNDILRVVDLRFSRHPGKTGALKAQLKVHQEYTYRKKCQEQKHSAGRRSLGKLSN